ncbi:MAG: sigma-70 family RNA polymerase sigma factor [Enhygromyxa sp.]
MSETPRPRLRIVGDSDAADRPPGPAESGPSSFAEAFRRHYALVHRMLRVYGVDEALLDDAAQDVFVVVHRRWDDYDGRTAFRSWLIGIVRRVASGYRRAGRRLRGRLERLGPPPAPASVETQFAQREELVLVEAFINQLGSRHREVFVLAEIEGLTAPEIAETLGIKLNTVYSRLRVARERFRATMARERSREQQGEKRGRVQR